MLLLDNAGFHTRPGLAIPDGLRLVYLLPYSPELQPAETLWTLVDEPLVNRLIPTLDEPANTIGARCCDLTERQIDISSRTNSAWWPKNRAPS